MHLTRKGIPFHFREEQRVAQEDLKKVLLASPALRPLDYTFNSPVILAVNTLPLAVSFYLCQADKDNPLMRRRRGSTHEYIHSKDLEQEARCSGATDRRTDGAATRTLQPPLRLIPSFRRPRAFSAHSDRPETRQEQ